MKKVKILSILIAGVLVLGTLAACGSQASPPAQSVAASAAVSAPPVSQPAASASPAASTVTIKGIADLVPHSELIAYVQPKLAAEGVNVVLVATAADETTNEKTAKGEIDFNYFQHWPYLKSWNETNGYNLVDAGDIHVEPITAYSDKYTSKDQIPDNATVAIPNDSTNEYRALRILEQNGFIKLNENTANTLSASVADIKEYIRPLKIVEIDSTQIIPTKDDYDFFITNTNKALEAKITSARLFSESGDSPYANIIATTAENKNNPAIVALVKALQSDDTRNYILQKYNGAVIPAKLPGQ